METFVAHSFSLRERLLLMFLKISDIDEDFKYSKFCI